MLTDGLYEVENAEGKMLDLDGFVAEFQRQCRLPPPTGSDETSALLQFVRSYSCENPSRDDQTLLLLRREQ
jgi:serine phosphatase RsbU (regulator of sigma subunit)